MEKKKIELEKLDLPIFQEEEESDFVKVACPSCKAQTKAKNIDLGTGIGKCEDCDALFSIKKQMNALKVTSDENAEVIRPAGVDSFYFKDELELELYQPMSNLDIVILSLLPFVFILAILLYFLKGVEAGLYVGVISSLIIATSVLRYVKRKEHKIYLNVNKSNITLQRRPKNFTKDKQYSVQELDQVYVAQTVDGAGLFFVMNSTDGQKHERVFSRIKNSTQLKYIEQEIERYLDLKNRKITGEI